MQNVIDEAKTELIRAKERIAKCLNATPEDKLNWSPSPGLAHLNSIQQMPTNINS